ncbi:hypothetical protein BT63DRAFT_454754 [Microthyrium microscopicum]|uniref:Ecp2 effector protein domain-containing protein n=1 Tax=Microthyrium microscopicum TaxID=703497 RepID=A0A6A6UHK0_9PEZI|nr:hypothetical protein BT63DRAFT_454754 [Microthyrium microscopicum]
MLSPFYVAIALMIRFSQLVIANPTVAADGMEAYKRNLEVGTYDLIDTDCDRPQWGTMTARGVSDAIDYLRGIQGTWTRAGGDNHCDRVSCSWNTGVFLCSTSSDEITHTWSEVADMFVEIQRKCGIGHVGQATVADFMVLAEGQDC